jgi:hypothetical protein
MAEGLASMSEGLEPRAAVASRFREMLQAQRDRFRDYLNILDKQKGAVERGDAEAVLAHVDLEERIVTDIFNIQKTIEPLETMHAALAANAEGPDADEAGLQGLQTELAGLKQEASLRSAANRALLAQRMDQVSAEIKSLRGNPHAARRSVYADGGAPSMIDIKG